jgi:AAA domain
MDQFLEDLLNVGIPPSDIVRLGSYHKATATTKPLVLSEQKSDFKLKRLHWEIIDLIKSAVSNEAEELRKASVSLGANSVTKDEIMEHIEFEDSAFYDDFLLTQHADGMTKVGKKGKAVNKHYLLDQWARGKDAGIYSNPGKESSATWRMTSADRQHTLKRWKMDILRDRISSIFPCGERYNDALTRIDELRNKEGDRRVIQSKRFIGCTTTAAAKYVQSIQSATPNVLLVEEAGEIQESHLLTALGPDTEQMILIGDHKQLRPKCHYDLSVEKDDGYDMNRSMFERLILKGYPHEVLSAQHRMRPEISSLIRHLTYPNLVDAPKTQNRPKIRGFQDCVVFVNHSHPEDEVPEAPDWKDQNSSSSKKNTFEAEMTLQCTRYLGQQGYGTDEIVILTPYVGQLRLLFDILKKENDPVLNDLDSYDLVKAGLMPAATAAMGKKQIRISSIGRRQMNK